LRTKAGLKFSGPNRNFSSKGEKDRLAGRAAILPARQFVPADSGPQPAGDRLAVFRVGNPDRAAMWTTRVRRLRGTTPSIVGQMPGEQPMLQFFAPLDDILFPLVKGNQLLLPIGIKHPVKEGCRLLQKLLAPLVYGVGLLGHG